MRKSALIFTTIAATFAVGCGSDDPSGTSSAASSGDAASTTGAGGSTSGATTTGATTSTSTGAGGGGSCEGAPLEGPCTPDATCPETSSPCLALADNCGVEAPLLRIDHFTFSKPDVLAAYAVATIVANAAMPNRPACHLQGGGTFSWLLQYSAEKGTFKTGSASPPAKPSDGYCFTSTTVSLGGQSYSLVPTLVEATFNPDGVVDADIIDALTMPIYLDVAASDGIALPLRDIRVHAARLTDGGSCIGAYNAQGLDPNNLCTPEASVPQYLDDGQIDAYIPLEEADAVIVASLNQSLCLLLTPGGPTYSDGGSPARCKRDGNGNIVFQGDWCGASNKAATPTCSDAMQLAATFAASGVPFKAGCQ